MADCSYNKHMVHFKQEKYVYLLIWLVSSGSQCMLLKKITFGFHKSKNLLIKNSTSRGKNLWWMFLNFLISFSAKLLELNVTVVIKNSKFLFLFNSFMIGNILWNSPMLAAWNQINLVFFAITWWGWTQLFATKVMWCLYGF